MPRWRSVVAGAALVAVTLGAGAAVWWMQTAEPRLEHALERWLSDRLNSDVSIESFDVQLFPTVRIEGRNLVLRIKDRPDLAPFITIRRWEGSGDVAGLLNKRLRAMRLEGAEIIVPPGRKEDLRPLRVSAPTGGAPAASPRGPLVDRLEADQVLITVQPRHADRDPVRWDVRDLVIDDFSLDAASPFSASVDTPLPKDRALATGTVGPWPRRNLETLPLQGKYTFDGDLSAVPGLAGKVHVTGSALGALERLETVGEASSVELGLSTGRGGRLPLNATYQAIFDGTSGDLALTRMTTRLGRSTFEWSGSVLRQRGVPGRHVSLQTRTPEPVDLADVMRLLVERGVSPVGGRLGLRAGLDIPAGTGDVQDRLTVDGTFSVARARFNDQTVRDRIDGLSRRGQGRPTDAAIADVTSDMAGRVLLRRRQLRLDAVRFTVPGATIEASGRYGLVSEKLDFRGIARLDATFSNTQTGVRRLFLKPIDPLLRKDGAGTRLVLDVAGTRDAPKLDLDLGASLRGRH